MNKSMSTQQSFGFFSSLKNKKNEKQSYSIDPIKMVKKLLIQTIICIILFFTIFSMKSINTEATNKMTKKIGYRLSQEFKYKESYHSAIGWGKEWVIKGETALETLNFGEYTQRSFTMPAEGNIAIHFNEVDTSSGKPLKGIVVEAKEGADVVAADEGVVIEVNASQGLGYYIIVKHRGEYLSVYKHLQEASVEVNRKVVKGEVIGISSDKLLFEVWQRKEPIDPMQFINLEEISL